MKKIAFTVIALLGLGTASFAQNSYDGVRPTTNRSQDLPRNRVLADNGVDSPFLRRFGFAGCFAVFFGNRATPLLTIDLQ